VPRRPCIPNPRTKDLCVNGQRVTVRYNDTCHFYQPPRAHHCSVNDNCIERFDHHCPWVGTTIGKVRAARVRACVRVCVGVCRHLVDGAQSLLVVAGHCLLAPS
jgi:hypothetical protein